MPHTIRASAIPNHLPLLYLCPRGDAISQTRKMRIKPLVISSAKMNLNASLLATRVHAASKRLSDCPILRCKNRSSILSSDVDCIVGLPVTKSVSSTTRGSDNASLYRYGVSSNIENAPVLSATVLHTNRCRPGLSIKARVAWNGNSVLFGQPAQWHTNIQLAALSECRSNVAEVSCHVSSLDQGSLCSACGPLPQGVPAHLGCDAQRQGHAQEFAQRSDRNCA